MPLTPPPPEPQPHDERPLSGREKQALTELEARLRREDPALNDRMARSRPSLVDQVSDRAFNLAVQCGVVLVVALATLPPAWRATLLVLLVMAVPPVAAAIALRHAQRDPPSTDDPPSP